MQKFIHHTWALLVLVGLVYVLNRPWGTVPALGKLFSPFHGFLQHVEMDLDKGRRIHLSLTGLWEDVQVKYDDRGVPHVFAENDHDLYFSQGYVVAKDRLWQMDFYTRAAAGRLSEIFGPRALDLDRYHRRIGMAKTAQELVAHIQAKDSLAYAILNAYADGVNAYLAQLDQRSWPLEYKLLGYAPEPWSPYKSILMLMNMRRDLSGGTDDFRMNQILAHLGEEVTAQLYPNYPHKESPIVPEGTSWDFNPLPSPPVPPAAGDGALDSLHLRTSAIQVQKYLGMDFPAPTPEIGSNNWAISGTKTASGFPLLSNDPHLTLTLPSIWYQIQMSAPDVNVYGVSIPGTPAVIIGFNQYIAWGVTNVGSDVLDFYEIQFKDSQREQYLHDGEWKSVNKRLEVFRVKGQKDLVDTIYFTHHGPVVYHEKGQGDQVDFPVGHAMAWMGNYAESSDLLTFHYLNRARNYKDYRSAISYFASPAQNFVFADTNNDIAITSHGKFPLKWKGQGKFLLDGRRKDHDWAGYVPMEHNPHSYNPPRGFVSSANQFPADTTYPYYLGWAFAAPTRGLRINDRLAQMKEATVEDFKNLLHDNHNLEAEWLLPMLLEELRAEPSLAEHVAINYLETWDLQNAPESVAASIFERWIPALADDIWNDEFGDAEPVRNPILDRTFRLLLEEADSPWFDDKRTVDKIETRGDIIRRSFKSTIERLEKEFGPITNLESGKVHPWAWALVKQTNINHLVPNFAQFSRKNVYTGGGPRIVNATSRTHGPSWRMIVQLDASWPKAWGLFPGGQSGNPGSRHYDDMVDTWAAGELDELVFLKDAQEEHLRVKQTIRLYKKRP